MFDTKCYPSLCGQVAVPIGRRGTLTMTDYQQTRRRVLQAAGVAIGSSIVAGTASADHEETWRFDAELTGGAETHDVETQASGHATFEIPPDDHRIHYSIDVEWLCNPTQAHIHLGEEGEDGPVVVWLYPEETQEPELIEGRFDGTLAEGTFTVDDLVGPLEDGSEGELITALLEEDAYVNVHTEAYPAGEIRGQVRPDGDTAEMADALADDGDAGEQEDADDGDEEETDGTGEDDTDDGSEDDGADDMDGDDAEDGNGTDEGMNDTDEGTDGGNDTDDYDDTDGEDEDGDDGNDTDEDDGTAAIGTVFDRIRALFV